MMRTLKRIYAKWHGICLDEGAEGELLYNMTPHGSGFRSVIRLEVRIDRILPTLLFWRISA